jgi:hypothetical protein
VRVGIVCDRPDAVLVHKPTWVADGFRAAGHSVVLVNDLAGLRAADINCGAGVSPAKEKQAGRLHHNLPCDLILFDHKASGLNRAALAEMAHCRLSLRERTLCQGHTFAERKTTIWVQWWRDLIAMEPAKPLVEQDHFRAFASVMRGMDIVFVKERSLLDEYHQLGINAHWLDQACPADMPACEHRRANGDGFVLPERPEWDVLVLGSTGYLQRRADARALADAGFRVLWAGMAASDPVPSGVDWHPWVHPFKLPELASRCGVVLGVDWRCDLPGYTSDRTYLACGMGACYVARSHHDATPQTALAAWTYASTDELIEIVRIAMSDVDKRRRRGDESRRRVTERHTYAHRAEEIVNLVAPKVRNVAGTLRRAVALGHDGM